MEPPASWRSPEPVEEPEEHFEPGPTAPLPAGDLQFWGILAGLVGGPLLLLFLVLFNREGNPLWMLLAVGITVAGFGLLVQRLPRHRDEDDDGAVLWSAVAGPDPASLARRRGPLSSAAARVHTRAEIFSTVAMP